MTASNAHTSTDQGLFNGSPHAPEGIVCDNIAMRANQAPSPTGSENNGVHYCSAVYHASDSASLCILGCTAPVPPQTVSSTAETVSFLVRHPKSRRRMKFSQR